MKQKQLHNPDGRIEYIDLARGIAIVAVLFGHISLIKDSPFQDNYSMVQSVIYSFHVPLFFFISGLCFSNRTVNFSEFLLKKLRAFGIPYITFSFLWYIYELATAIIIYHKQMTVQFLAGKALKYILQIRYLPLWFLTCLFIVELLFYWILRISKEKKLLMLAMTVGFFAVGIVYRLHVGKDLIWNADLSLLLLPFTVVGFLLKSANLKSLRRERLLFAAILLFVIGQLTNYFNTKYFSPHYVDIMYNCYGSFVLFYLSSFLGIASVMLFSIFFENKGSILKYLGQNTLMIFALHQIIFRVCESVLLRYSFSNLQLYLIWGMIIVLTLAIFIGVTYIVNHTQLCVLIGKRYERKKL
ncbi:MAG: acyltransferase family protein [Eubacterium sp.]|nr:acyltransferase family protein [Eubacterium sp.]